MIVGNWMQADPITIGSDTLVSEAKRLLSENNLHALPVVDDGRLRGLVTRANLLRMGQFVLRTQDPDEFNFFVTRVKVRDIMVRNPATVQVDDTMEHCLLRGQELGVAQFPVVDGERVVGVISANEIFQLAAHCLGAWERRSGVTLAPVKLGPGMLGHIADVVESAGAVLLALIPVGRHDRNGAAGTPEKKVIVRFHADDVRAIASALEEAGFPVIESVEAQRPGA
ncbi:MAG: protein stimulating phenylphosphate synthetase activity [Betaproteobacteria bacterium CG2_30_68_42]|nr:MAG: protein stimulating phenylphosphate synthetase activity [Betaproteobacteria bacterium CG2_30_68_42]